MNQEQAEEVLNTFPEFAETLVKIKKMNILDKKKYGQLLVLGLLTASSEADGDILAYLDRTEHLINKELAKSPDALAMLATLSRVRYKINKLMDNQIIGLKE